MEYLPSDSAYAVGDSRGNAPYALYGEPYAEPLTHGEFDGTPDPQRVGDVPAPDMRQEPFQPQFWERRGAESQRRESVGTVRTFIRELLRRPKTVAPDPRETPPDNVRPTAELSPSNFGYSNPSATGGIPRTNNGEHFSMADHIRNFAPSEIFGMTPARSGRSGLRLDVANWGEDVIDVPQHADPSVNERYTAPVAPPSLSAYRLG